MTFNVKRQKRREKVKIATRENKDKTAALLLDVFATLIWSRRNCADTHQPASASAPHLRFCSKIGNIP